MTNAMDFNWRWSMRNVVMQQALVIGFMAALISVPFGVTNALADNKHVAEAVEHAKGAAKEKDAKAVVKHAEEALKHAQAAQKDMKNPHLDEGVHQLKEAVEHGKAGHADVAAKAADSAAMHLSEVK